MGVAGCFASFGALGRPGAASGRSFNVSGGRTEMGAAGLALGFWALGLRVAEFRFWDFRLLGLGGRRLRFMDIGFGLRDHGLIRKFRPYALKP